MIIFQREEVEQLAREEYARRVKDAPEPVVINVEPLVTLDAPRDFAWGGIGYRAPPLSFTTGLRLLVAANALRDLRMADAPDEERRRAIRIATRDLRPAVFAHGRLNRFLDWRLPCPFLRSEPTEFEGLLRWLLFAPDQSPLLPSTGKVTVDLIDGLAAFVREFPAWVGSDGYPLTWSRYLYGMRHLSRVSARIDLRTAAATRMAGVTNQRAWTDWASEMRAAAGWL
ncbi:MAG TPA: hypothetical protein VFZ96_00005 [Actinomycetota bacterium]|nr:hypothetical protein [Actinomycetota bacterium]